MKKIILIEDDSVDKDAMHAAREHLKQRFPDVELIENDPYVVVVNGVRYRQIDRKPNPRMARRMLPILGMAAMFGGMPAMKDNLPECDVVKEFELIELKKSKYSKSIRDRIEGEFHSLFEKI